MLKMKNSDEKRQNYSTSIFAGLANKVTPKFLYDNLLRSEIEWIQMKQND